MDMVERLAQRIDLNAGAAPPPAPLPFATPDLLAVDTEQPLVGRLDPDMGFGSKKAEVVDLDLNDLGARGFLTHEAPHTLLAEEYRIIKRPLLRAAFTGQRHGASRSNVALITSARPSEGKTFTAVNLAVSIAAEADHHVLLVDADVRQRGLSRAFGLTERRGLTEVINDPTLTLADVILRTNIPNLSVIPAGAAVKSPTEMFAGQRARELFMEMTQRYGDRFIILDSPPVLASSEPGVLATYVGQIVMIALAGETPKQAIADSLGLLDTNAPVNFILNKVTPLAAAGRFGYYGTYGEN